MEKKMKKLLLYIAISLFASSAFAKTTGFMMRNNGPLREDKGNGGVEWATTVPEGTPLTIESEEPVLLTLITEKEKFDNIKFYKVTYEKKTYYARESEVALGKTAAVILADTTLFTKPAISSFLNAQIEQASVVVAGEKTTYAQSDFTEIQYWSDSASTVRKRYVFSNKVSENKNDFEAVRTVDVALALKNKDASKEKAMKEELFKNAKKLNTSREITDYIQTEYDKLFGAALGIFTKCVIDQTGDQIILSDESGKTVLSVWLYGKEIVFGEYQVLGSEGEPLLEGTLQKDGGTQNVKTTLFINYSDRTIQVSGQAELYEPNGTTKSGEVLNFACKETLAKAE